MRKSKRQLNEDDGNQRQKKRERRSQDTKGAPSSRSQPKRPKQLQRKLSGPVTRSKKREEEAATRTQVRQSEQSDQSVGAINEHLLEPRRLRRMKQLADTYEFKELAPLDPSKKLLVLGLQGTLICRQKKRPHLAYFMEQASQFFNIVIWVSSSALKQAWEFLKWLKKSCKIEINIKIVIEEGAMVRMKVDGRVARRKPLAVVWLRYPHFSARNTIVVDSDPQTYALNPEVAIAIPPFGQHDDKHDKCLIELTRYLSQLDKLEDLRTHNHECWMSARGVASTYVKSEENSIDQERPLKINIQHNCH